MKYTVNWVEKNLGVSRKTLRIYEDKGLMDKTTFQEYYIELVERKELGASDPVVQTFVNLIYRYYCEHLFPAEIIEGMTPQKFARYIARSFTVGDISVMQEKNYGKDGCKFIAEALAHFGGYSSVNEMD